MLTRHTRLGENYSGIYGNAKGNLSLSVWIKFQHALPAMVPAELVYLGLCNTRRLSVPLRPMAVLVYFVLLETSL
jgi:hypothetical protein